MSSIDWKIGETAGLALSNLIDFILLKLELRYLYWVNYQFKVTYICNNTTSKEKNDMDRFKKNGDKAKIFCNFNIL